MLNRKILFVFLVFVLIFGSGCNVVQIGGGSKIKRIETKPEVPEKLREDIRRATKINKDLADVAFSAGIEAGSKESIMLVKAADKLQTHLGLPAIPVDIGNPELVDNVATEIKQNIKG